MLNGAMLSHGRSMIRVRGALGDLRTKRKRLHHHEESLLAAGKISAFLQVKFILRRFIHKDKSHHCHQAENNGRVA